MNENNEVNEEEIQSTEQTEEQSANGTDTPSGTSGKGQSIASLVLGIVAVVCWFFGYSSILSVILGVVGVVLASNAKKAGYNSGIRTAGFVLSLIGLIGGAVFFLACSCLCGAVGVGLSSLS